MRSAEVRDAGPRHATRGDSTIATVVGVFVGTLVTATLVGFLGRWWLFELSSNLRPQLAVVLAGLVVVLVVQRRWPMAVLAAAAALLNLSLIVPFVAVGQPPPPAPDAARIDVTFLNTKIRGADIDQVIDYLRRRDDDVVVLAATTGRWVRGIEEADLDLTVASGTHLHPGLELLTLTRDPDAEVTVHRPTQHVRDALVEVELELDDEPVRLLATHAMSPGTPNRLFRRDLSLTYIAGAATRRETPLIVMGDLNVTPWSPRFHELLEEGGLVDPLRYHGLQPSWPAQLGPFGIPIDHVLHSPELTTVERRLGPSFGSGHRAIHASLARREEPPASG